jgi:peptide/nickel transport system permease protein
MKKDRQIKNDMICRFCKNKAALVGFIILSIFICAAIFADFIAPYSRGIFQDDTAIMAKPGREHLFGTDDSGRDIFTRIVHGARFSLALGFTSTLSSILIALILGSLAGYFGGKLDEVITRIVDTMMCIPDILLSLAIVASLGPGLKNLMIAITVGSVPGFTRLIRSIVLGIVENDYIEAARACGTSDAGIIYHHVIRNVMGPVIVQATMCISGRLLLAAGLSFIGLGVRPPAPEWGAMLSGGREFLRRAPHLLIFPGSAILLTALSFNLVGDGLRDALDPRLRN